MRNDTFHRLEERSCDSHLDFPSRMSAGLQVIHSWKLMTSVLRKPLEGRDGNAFELQKENKLLCCICHVFHDLVVIIVYLSATKVIA